MEAKETIEALNGKTNKDVMQRIYDLFVRTYKGHIAQLLSDNAKTTMSGMSGANRDFYSMIFSVFATKELTDISERQEAISQDIHTSVNDSTDVAIEVRELTKDIKTLTRRMFWLTFVAVEAAIISIILSHK